MDFKNEECQKIDVENSDTYSESTDSVSTAIAEAIHRIVRENDPDFENMTVKELRKAASKKRTPREFVIASLARSELRRRGFNK